MPWLVPILIVLAPKADDPTSFEVSVPIDARGEADLGLLVARLAQSAGLPLDGPAPTFRAPVRGLAGSLTRTMLAETLGGDVAIRAEGDVLTLSWAAAAGWREHLHALAGTIGGEAALARRIYGVRPRSSYRPNDPKRPTVLLVHGMNSASGCFVHMVPILERAGFGVVLYDFPDNKDLDETCPQFVQDLKAFRDRAGERRPWSIVAHSMGGLVARWHVEGETFAEDVDRLILIAPPNEGSALAKAQSLIQWIENVSLANSGRSGGLLELSEGLGAAAEDLAPRSAFLRALNARPRREGVAYHILAGDVGFLGREASRELRRALDDVRGSAGILGRIAALAVADIPAVLEVLSDGTGDGAVAVAATRLAGAPEPVVLHANHVELIRGPLLYPEPGPVACMPKVLEWLGAKPDD
jgi:pimeloyl-ACP methyl ester carboxylesterase